MYPRILSDITNCLTLCDALEVSVVFLCCLIACLSTHGVFWLFHTMLTYTFFLGYEHSATLIQTSFLLDYTRQFMFKRIATVHTCLHLAAVGREQECTSLQMKHVMYLALLLTCECVGCHELAANVCQLHALYHVLTTLVTFLTFNARWLNRGIFFGVEMYLFCQQTVLTDLVAAHETLCSGPMDIYTLFVTGTPLRCWFGFSFVLYFSVMVVFFSCLHAAETLS